MILRLLVLLLVTVLFGTPAADLAAQTKLPSVKVVATGGTIANTPSERLHAGEVAEAIPESVQLT